MQGWSIEPHCWEDLARFLFKHEQKWVRHYLEQEYILSVPETSGIYLICSSLEYLHLKGDGEIMNRLYNALYVGQSKNLQKRFCQHLRSNSKKIGNARYIFRRLEFWYSKCNPEHLDDFEQLLLNALGPTANDINVKAKIGESIPAG